MNCLPEDTRISTRDLAERLRLAAVALTEEEFAEFVARLADQQKIKEAA